jgi:Flp pilus assembly protein TadG
MRLLAGLRNLHRDESGQAMVEFVLVFPVQLVLSLLILQFCFVAHAHLVVQQAAFLGARAGAVADAGKERTGFSTQEEIDSWAAEGKKAARRVAGRTVGVLTSGGAPTTPDGADDDDRKAMRWHNANGGGNEFNANRVKEAFAHLEEVKFIPYPQDGYVACSVTYDYLMFIPVANHILAKTQMIFGLGTQGTYNEASQKRGVTCYRINRVSFIATPWTRELRR